MKMYQRKTEKKRSGKRVLAWIMTFAMVLSLVMVPAGKVQAAEEVTVSDATNDSNDVYVVMTVEKTIAANSNDAGNWPSQELTQYKVSIVNNSETTISDWEFTISCASALNSSTYNSGWNGAPTSVSGKDIVITTYKGTDDKTGEVWDNATIEAGQTLDTGAGFQVATSSMNGATYTLKYNIGESSGNIGQDDTQTDPSQIGTSSTKVTSTITQSNIAGNYHEYYLQVNNGLNEAISDWIVAIPLTGVSSSEAWGSWAKVKVSYTSSYLYLTPSSGTDNVILAGGSFGSTTEGAYKFNYKGSVSLDTSKAVVYYKTGSTSTGAFDNVVSSSTQASGGSGDSGNTGGSGGVQGDTTTDLNLDVEYNFAKLLQESLYFYDANMCGELEGKCALDWRGNCHLGDKTQVSYGGQVIDVSGGFHDAGDHDKFGIPQGYSAAILGIGYYEFKDAYEETGQSEHFETILDYFCDYFVRCTVLDNNGDAKAFCYQVGDGSSHNSWVAAEKENISRPGYFADSSNPATDHVSIAAAALAIHYMNFGNETYLDCAKKLFAMAKANPKSKKTTDNGTFYESSSWEDDYCLAAAWLYKATNDSSYMTEYNAYKGSIATGAWPSWDQVGPYALAYGGGDFSPLAANATTTLNSTTTISNGYSWLCMWGSARYNCNIQLEGLIFDKNSGKEQQYTEWATGQMKFLLGNSEDKRCYVVGYNENSSKYPHHRSASGYSDWPANGNNHTVQAHVLLGALVGGIKDSSGTYIDDSDDFYCNEVAIDYNAAFVGATAALYLANKDNDAIETDLATEDELSAVGVTTYYGTTQTSTTKPTGVTLNITSKDLAVGDTCTLKATVAPKDASQKVKWTSSDTSIATVSSSGVVTAKASGTATITATTVALMESGDAAMATCEVKVLKAGELVSDKEALECSALTYGYEEGSSVSASLTNTGEVSITPSSIDFENGDYFVLVKKPETAIEAGKEATIEVKAKTGLGAGTYTDKVIVSYASKTLEIPVSVTVAKKELTIKVNDADRVYGEKNPTFSLDESYEDDLVAGDSIRYTFTTTATEASDVGTYPIEAEIEENANYKVTVQTGVLTINPKGITRINFPVASGLKVGQTLSESTLSEGDTKYGSFAWKDASVEPSKGTKSYDVVLTLSASAIKNYSFEGIEGYDNSKGTVTQAVTVNVTRADLPEVVFPTATSIAYGDTLAASTFVGGSTEYGSFEWEDATYVLTTDDIATGSIQKNVVFTWNEECKKQYSLEADEMTQEQMVTVQVAKQENGEVAATPELASRTASRIVVTETEGVEYSIDGVNWQKSGTFTGLSGFTLYKVYARFEETATHYAGETCATPLQVYTLVANPYNIDVSIFAGENAEQYVEALCTEDGTKTIAYDATKNTLTLLKKDVIYTITGNNKNLVVLVPNSSNSNITLNGATIKKLDLTKTNGDSSVVDEIVITGTVQVDEIVSDSDNEVFLSGKGTLNGSGIAVVGELQIHGPAVSLKTTGTAITASDVLINTSSVSIDAQTGIVAEENIVIKGYKVTITCDPNGAGLVAGKSVQIEGGSVTINAGEGCEKSVIVADNIIVSSNSKVTSNVDFEHLYSSTPKDENGNEVVNPEKMKVTKITLSASTKTIKTGESATLTTTVEPANAYDKSVTWTSSNPSVATVDKDGKVTGIAAGVAKITATASDGSSISASCTVTVTSEEQKDSGDDEEQGAIVALEKIKITGATKKVAPGKKLKLKATVYPADATNAKVVWKVNNTKYAKVNSNTGVVTTKKAGRGKKVTVTAYSAEDNSIKATYKISIMKNPVKKIKLSAKTKIIKKGQSVKVKAVFTPTKGISKELTWKSSNKKIATVNSKGKVTGKKKGTVKITAKAKDGSGKKATIRIRVK